MNLRQEVTRIRQVVSLLSTCGYYHGIKMVGNLIDGQEGVMEQRISQLLARRLLDQLDYQVTVSGLEHVEGLKHYCVVSTHASHVDWAVLLAHYPTPLRFVAKKELLPIPVVGDYLKKRAILIDRRAGVNAKQAIKNAAQDDNPWPILIFPEGTRSPDGQIQPFKRGGLQILAGANLAMVPVCIRGTFAAFSRHDRVITPGLPLTMTICPKVMPADFDSVEAAMREVERQIHRAAAQSDI